MALTQKQRNKKTIIPKSTISHLILYYKNQKLYLKDHSSLEI